MRTLREGTQLEASGRNFTENPQGGDSVRTVRGGNSVRTPREGTQLEPSRRGLSENPQGGDSVRTLREGTQ